MRCGGSALEGRLTSFFFVFFAFFAANFGGKAGSGGGCSPAEDDGLEEGDCSRKVLSVMEPELPCRWSAPGRAAALPLDEMDPRRCVRFVCTSLTGVGEVVWERRAAAAAAEERLAFEGRLARNACAAAVAAAAVVGDFAAAYSFSLGMITIGLEDIVPHWIGSFCGSETWLL